MLDQLELIRQIVEHAAAPRQFFWGGCPIQRESLSDPSGFLPLLLLDACSQIEPVNLPCFLVKNDEEASFNVRLIRVSGLRQEFIKRFAACVRECDGDLQKVAQAHFQS